jgi:hypothetical protein
MSGSQIFKQPFPAEILFSFLDSNAAKSGKYYLFSSASFKKGMFNGSIIDFIEKCKSYYHISKHSYLERKLTYSGFNTIIRQICKFNKITYTSKIKYDKSDYDIVYYIYYL